MNGNRFSYGYTYTYDANGNILTASKNGKTISYTYDAWGKTTSVTGRLAFKVGYLNSLRYRGYYYDPEWGRFINADTTEVLAKDNTTIESNIFVYCNNDPVNFNDYTGCLPSSKKFKKAADSLWKICIKQYSWIKFSSVAMIVARSRFNKAINYIYRYSNHIKIVSMQYRVPENIIGGIILKEVFTQSISDNIANIDTFIRGANHSTGLGAIFATTARSAWKYVNPKYKLPSSNRTLQYTLSKNNYFNITTIGVVLVHKAYLAKLIKYPYQARSLSLIQWKKAVVKYNGKAIYANRVWQYLSYIHTILYAR